MAEPSLMSRAEAVIGQGPASGRSMAVWIVCSVSWTLVAFGALGIWLLATERVAFPPEQVTGYVKRDVADYLMASLFLLMAMIGSVQLFLARRDHVHLLGVGLILFAVKALWVISAFGTVAMVGACFLVAVTFAIYGYVWGLDRKGVLR